MGSECGCGSVEEGQLFERTQKTLGPSAVEGGIKWLTIAHIRNGPL